MLLVKKGGKLLHERKTKFSAPLLLTFFVTDSCFDGCFDEI